MNLNLKVRARNPVFWFNVILGALTTALAYAGLTAADLTTWQGVIDVIKNTMSNPYCLGLVLVNIWNSLIDTTTSGFGDSTNAMSYTHPKKD